MLAGDVDPGQDLDIGVGSPEKVHVGFVVKFVIFDDDVFGVEGQIVPAWANIVELLCIFEDQFLADCVPRRQEDELFQTWGILREVLG